MACRPGACAFLRRIVDDAFLQHAPRRHPRRGVN
jgi:hypothetical protein